MVISGFSVFVATVLGLAGFGLVVAYRNRENVAPARRYAHVYADSSGTLSGGDGGGPTCGGGGDCGGGSGD